MYTGCISYQGQETPFDKVEFSELAALAKKTFNGAGVVFLGTAMSAYPVSLDEAAQNVRFLSAHDFANLRL